MIKIIVEGFLKKDNDTLLEAHSTVTALCGEEYTAIVDTSSRKYRSKLLEGLEDAGIAAEEVTAVILTHTHEDHVANIDLFPNAQLFAHELEKPAFNYAHVNDGDEIFPGIKIMHTPGHTLGSISIVVQNENCIIAGDAIPTEANILRNVPPGICADREKAIISMQNIISSADFIIPGHGTRICLSK